MSKRLPTIRQLTEQLKVQGALLLTLRSHVVELVADSAKRDKLAVANAVSATQARLSRADAPEVARDRDYGAMVREVSAAEVSEALGAEIGKIHAELREHANAISEFGRDRTGPVNPLEVEGNVVRDTIAASCHLVADVIARNGVAKIGKVDPTHIENLRRAAAILRDEETF